MTGYYDTYQLIVDTLTQRPYGTEIQPEDHQAFALSLLNYIRSVELVAGNGLPIAFADENTVPVQPDNGYAVYLAKVNTGDTVVYTNFVDQYGHAISITSANNVVSMVTLLWNGIYWSAQVTEVHVITDTRNGFLFKGILQTVDDVPDTVINPVFYIADKPGTYTNFSNLVVGDEVCVFRSIDGTTWTKETCDFLNNAGLKKAKQNNPQTGYYECDTAAAVLNKKVTAEDYVLNVGGSIKIKMLNAHTSNWLVTLNINGTGAKPLLYRGAPVSAQNSWKSGEVIVVYYDGTSFYANNVETDKFSTGEEVRKTGIDAEPTAGSDNLPKSGGVYEYANKVIIVDFWGVDTIENLPAPTAVGKYQYLTNSQTLVKSAMVNGDLEWVVATKKENTLYIDFTHRVSYIYKDGDMKHVSMYGIEIDQAETTISILPNVLNKWGAVESLNISLVEGEQGCVNEYELEFTVDGDDFRLILPNAIRWASEPSWDDGYTYQVSILNNLAVYAAWEDVNA